MTWFLIALSSAFLSAFAAVTQKKVLFGRGALEFTFVLSIFNLVLSAPFFFFVDYSTVNWLNSSVLLLKSGLAAGAFLCVMTVLKNMEISRALPLLALTPGFVAVFAFFFLGESLSITDISGLFLLIAGTYILESGNLKDILLPFSTFIRSENHHYVLLALVFFTAAAILDKILLVKLNFTPVTIIAFQHLIFAVLFAVIFLLFGKKNSEKGRLFRKEDIGWILLISVVTIGYRYTNILSFSLASVALTLAVKRTSVLWATIIGGKIFNETNLLRKIIAVLFILSGVFLILNGI